MAYEMVMPYHLHMPSYFLETFTEYPRGKYCYQRITGTYETVLVIPAWEGRYHLFFDLFHQYLKTCSSPGSMVMAFIPFRVGMFSTPFPPSDLIRISFLSI